MKSYILFLALLLVLGCSASPLYNAEIESMSTKGLEAAVTEANSMYATSNLYRVTRASVKRVVPVGLRTIDIMMKFDMKETECTKASKSDPQTCAFTSGFFVPFLSCSSRVRMTPTSTQVLSVMCGRDGSSSSESSEEMFSRGRQTFNIPLTSRAVPAPSAPPAQAGRPLLVQLGDVRHKGDAFNNFVV